MDLVKWNTPFSLKLKLILSQLGRCAEGAIADRDLEGEILRNLPCQANDLFPVSAIDHRRLTKVRVITQDEVVYLRAESEKKEPEKSATAEARKWKQTASTSKQIECLSATTNLVKQWSMLKSTGTNLQKTGSHEE
jgi:hypothetical protein